MTTRNSPITQVKTFLDTWVFFAFSDRLKFGIKVSLSLMLSFMIPLAMGWEQPNTAAITVMLIATAGVVSESVMKGAIRIVGTIIGAVIGLTLIALFPQERMTYLLVLSIIIPLILYLYNAYQGDGTVFMLMGMTIMMVFQGGNVENSFLYGVDRTYMTVFGIVIYTLVGIFLWPVKQEDSTIEDALELTILQKELFEKILESRDKNSDEVLLTKMDACEKKLQSAYVEASGASMAMALNASTWESISKLYGRLGALMSILSAHTQEKEKLEYAGHIEGYEQYLSESRTLFSECEEAWKNEKVIAIPAEREIKYITDKSEALSNLQRSIIVTHAEIINKIHHLLRVLADRLNTLNGETSTIESQHLAQAAPHFIWLDPEYLRGVVQTFLIFWFSTAMWIYFNPPGGFILVTLATLLSLLTSFSPLKPSVLTKLFTVGFVFAIAMYILVLPNLVYGWQLALFIFCYSFIAFYVINPKMSIFFLLGMYTLGISNTMSYNFDIFLIVLLMFYLFLAILMLFYYLPFSTKPEHLFVTMKKRLFWHATAMLKRETVLSKMNWLQKKRHLYHTQHLVRTAQKLTLWASQINTKHFNSNTTEKLMAFTTECTRFSTKVELLVQYEQRLENNSVYAMLKALQERNVLAEVSASMIEGTSDARVEKIFHESEDLIEQAEQKIDEVKESLKPGEYTKQEISEFYINIALRHSVWIALNRSHNAMKEIDFERLQENRF